MELTISTSRPEIIILIISAAGTISSSSVKSCIHLRLMIAFALIEKSRDAMNPTGKIVIHDFLLKMTGPTLFPVLSSP